MADSDHWTKIVLENGATIERDGMMIARDFFVYSNGEVRIRFYASQFTDSDEESTAKLVATDRWLVSMGYAAIKFYSRYYKNGEAWISQQIERFKADISVGLVQFDVRRGYSKPTRVEFAIDHKFIDEVKKEWLSRK